MTRLYAACLCCQCEGTTTITTYTTITYTTTSSLTPPESCPTDLTPLESCAAVNNTSFSTTAPTFR